MLRFTMILFVIVLVITAYFTFARQPADMPNQTSFVGHTTVASSLQV